MRAKHSRGIPWQKTCSGSQILSVTARLGIDFARHDNPFQMNKRDKNLWQGIDPGAQNALTPRDYRTASFAQELAQRGVDAGELVAADKNQREIKEAWIPGVEIFARKIHPQRHRGCFGEFVRRDEGILARIGLWPKQWSAARMFAYTAKGFHVHPPSVPEGSAAADWLRRLFVDEPENYSLRRTMTSNGT